MVIDQNDRNPPNSIIKLSKAFDDLHASKSNPNRPFPSHRIYKVHTEKQTDERGTAPKSGETKIILYDPILRLT
jgi:hypothetical protein